MLFLIFVATLAQAAPEAAPSEPAERPSQVLTNADWIRKPTGEDFARLYPEAAQRKNVPGRATIECKVQADGGLTGCQAIEESPAGEGFGPAALKMASRFKMRPLTKDGHAVEGGTIRIPIQFVLGGHIDAMSAELSCYGQAAALIDREPASVPAWTALTFYSAQLAANAAKAKSTAGHFEDDLKSAHMGAAAGRSPASGPTLKSCLEFATSHMTPVTVGR